MNIQKIHQLKKHQKSILAIALLIIFTLYILTHDTIKTEGYSVDNAYNIIQELSSEKYKGRRYGTEENMKAVAYIEAQFKAIGLKPAGENGTYRYNYMENTRVYKSPAAMELLDKNGNVVKSYKYGEDFKERSTGQSASGEIISEFNFLNYYEDIEYKKTTDNQKVAVIYTNRQNRRGMFQAQRQVALAGYEAIITTATEDVNFRKESAGLWGRRVYDTGYEMPAFIIKDRVADELLKYYGSGYKLRLKSGFDVALKPTADVLGMIPGKSKDYVLLTCHLDHIGPGSDGYIYPGALDNASGVGAMIELARFIKSQGKTPEKNIVFVAWNGEEGGLLGSKHYVTEPLYPLAKTTVLNLDMVGAAADMPLTLLYSKTVERSQGLKVELDPSSQMRYHLKELAKRLRIPVVELNESNSDHYYFDAQGIPAVTLIDYELERTHTNLDNMDNVGKSNLDRALKLAIGYLSITAFSNTSAFGYNMAFEETTQLLKALWPYMVGVAAVLLAYFLLYRKRKESPDSMMYKVPVLSIQLVLLLLGIVSYFPMQYNQLTDDPVRLLDYMTTGIISLGASSLLWPLFGGFVLLGAGGLYWAKHRMNRWDYEGTGAEFGKIYYIAIGIVAISSLCMPYMFGKPLHLRFTPEFARDLGGMLILLAVLAVVAYLVHKLIRFEIGMREKWYGGLVVFSIVFYMMICAFYMPIATNRYIMYNNNSSSINMEGIGTPTGMGEMAE